MLSRISRRVVAAVAILTLVSLLAPTLGGTSTAEAVSPVVYRVGSTGPGVKKLQSNLSYLGFYTSRVDGRYGSLTRSAMKGYQKARKRPVTGTASASDLRSVTRLKRIYRERRIDRRVLLGRSVSGRNLYAYQVGDPSAKNVVVVVGQFHGEEVPGLRSARSLTMGKQVRGVSMWVIETINPDGARLLRRQNARGVDLNRNWAHNWVPVPRSSQYYAGTRPYTEPETRILRDFLNKTDPRYVVGMHHPLNGIDSYQVKSWTLHNQLVRYTGLPSREFSCRGECHGTMTGWFNSTHSGAAITIEFPRTSSNTYQRSTFPRALVRALGGTP